MKIFLRIIIVFCAYTFASGAVYAQKNYNVDSLKKELAHVSNDTNRVYTLLGLTSALEGSAPDSAMMYAQKALQIAKRMSWDRGIASAEYYISIQYEFKGDKLRAIAYDDTVISIAIKDKNMEMLRTGYNGLGNIYSEESNFPKALEYYFKGLHIADSIKDKEPQDLYNNIGLVYEEMGDFSKALEYYFKSLSIDERLKNNDGIAVAYSNIGNIYNAQGNYYKGLDYHLKALKIDSSMGHISEVAQDYSNLGETYNDLNDYTRALEYGFRALDINEKLGFAINSVDQYPNIGIAFYKIFKQDSAGKGCSFYHAGTRVFIPHNALLDSALAYEQKTIVVNQKIGSVSSNVPAYMGMGDIYRFLHNYTKAEYNYHKAYMIADSIGALRDKMEAAYSLAYTMLANNQYKEAVPYLEQTIGLKDTLFGEEKQKALGKQEAQFEYDKKLLEQQKEHEKEQAIAAEEAKHQRFVTGGVSAGLIIVLVFTFLLFKRFKVTREQKLVIEAQKKEVDSAYVKLNDTHLQLQEKDKDITDSIAYAQKIQNAILPSDDYLKELLGEHFILFKPRDIVSGDFYWCHKAGNKVIFAVADCTGHGVPGAFMSMIGNSLLNQVVIENKVYRASEVLNQLRSNLLKLLQQRGQEAVTRDGMDIALCIWDKQNNTLEYAGANSPLYLVRQHINVSPTGKLKQHGDNLLEVLPDKQPIGYQEGKTGIEFNSQIIELKQGDYIYIASDGYHDQFGGDRDKKFTSSEFRKLLGSLIGKPMKAQQEVLNSTIEQWKGNYAQTDDICLLGIRIA